MDMTTQVMVMAITITWVVISIGWASEYYSLSRAVRDSAAAGSDTAPGNGGKSSGGGSSSGCGGSPDGGPLGSLFAGLLALGLVTRRRNA